ncbi:MAG: transglutaminase-like cysteine peptidase [Candidatus Devosia phytovorans]|uniref:Transglutaminase-like cysteine peptidase n=1 Tax=Candidatus Devosia phytovorans TaxID=3121372 RepID=A0AAJ5VUQ7_9HYPH|nr:transglutaminase-like cysteine peptidase [Devosia sp.]WEK03739.1 MAG: transglutaminase-like cysteine peptidase [Devosia sp.]
MSLNLAAAVIVGLVGTVFNQGISSPDLESAILRKDTIAVTRSAVNAVEVTATPAIRVVPADFGVFQSVAISAAGLPSAARWQEARETDYAVFFSAACETAGFEQCDSAFATTLRDVANRASGLERELLDMANRSVNGAMTYRDDRQVWGTSDHWATPVEMAARGAGDCEDYAIAKYWLLRSLGVADENLQLVILQDTRRQVFHAVLVAHMTTGSYVLDNVSNRLQADSAYGQYQPIMSFAGAKNFIHGFESGSRAVAAMPADLATVAPGVGP